MRGEKWEYLRYLRRRLIALTKVGNDLKKVEEFITKYLQGRFNKNRVAVQRDKK